MEKSCFIFNAQSGQFKPGLDDALVASLTQAGFPPAFTLNCAEEKLPAAAMLGHHGVSLCVAFAGDGTISALAGQLTGWDGTIVVLPGGTMNLLATALHGDADADAILAALAMSRGERTCVPVVHSDAGDALTGLLAGVTTPWVDVREALRAGSITSFAKNVPDALSATFSDEAVELVGEGVHFPAVFVDPVSATELSVTGFKIDGPAQLLEHGVAWLRRDFREGPHESLGQRGKVRLRQNGPGVVLIDGEKRDAGETIVCTPGLSGVRFFRSVENRVAKPH